MYSGLHENYFWGVVLARVGFSALMEGDSMRSTLLSETEGRLRRNWFSLLLLAVVVTTCLCPPLAHAQDDQKDGRPGGLGPWPHPARAPWRGGDQTRHLSSR